MYCFVLTSIGLMTRDCLRVASPGSKNMLDYSSCCQYEMCYWGFNLNTYDYLRITAYYWKQCFRVSWSGFHFFCILPHSNSWGLQILKVLKKHILISSRTKLNMFFFMKTYFGNNCCGVKCSYIKFFSKSTVKFAVLNYILEHW